MKIGVIGGGSIGLLAAALLCQSFEVTLYTKTRLQSEEINKNGIILVKENENANFKIKALPISEYAGREDLTFISVKQYQLEEIFDVLRKPKVIKGALAFLQNGMSHIKLLSTLENENILVGSVEHGAYRENAFTVRHNGIGLTRMAVYKGGGKSLCNFLNLVHDQFPVAIEDDYYAMLLKKLIANAIINPLTALLHVKNGQLIENPHFFIVFKELFNELTAIFNLEHPQEYLNQVIHICRKTSQNRSSMLKDMETNRRTEIDAILGYVLEEAASRGENAPLVRSLYHFVKGKEISGEGLR